jgi:hypothetical protein
MSKLKKILLLGTTAVLALLLLFGCSLLLKGDAGVPAEHGRYIKLNVGSPAARAITVKEFDVTGLEIQVLDPDEELLQTIGWDALEGPQSYLIPVTQTGQHQIVVTHFGERDGEEVEATESAVFTIGEMVITVIDIVPGCIGVIHVAGGGEEPPAPSLVGVWFGEGVEQPGDPEFLDAYITVGEDGSFESLLYDAGGATLQGMSMRGTYTVTDSTFNATTSEIYDLMYGWQPLVLTWSMQYTISGDTLTLHQDFDQDGTPDIDWILNRL